MALISARGLSLGYGGAPLLQEVGFRIERGERIALIGRNGAGKSTLMKILANELEPDGGEILAPSMRVARLAQEVPQSLTGSLFDVVASGLSGLGELLTRYHHLSHSLDGDADLSQLEDVQHQIEAAGGWHLQQRVETVMSKLKLPDEGRFETLSGGLKRRVLLARSLVAEPDLLLLDEPTNHLDIPAIEWLEELLTGLSSALLFITHDRAFLSKLATRIFELDRGRLTDWPGDYPRFLERKQHLADVEAEQNERFDKKLAQEEAWIRQGIKARRTRNEGRVRALEKLREERKARRQALGQARFRLDEVERSGKLIIEVVDLAFGYGDDDLLIKGLTTNVIRGDKIGILGANGSGKTTLLKLLLGRLQPTAGKVRHGTRIELAYFDQHREQLEEDKTVADNVADGNDKIVTFGKTRHIISYLQDFLFTPDRAKSPVSSLSGGERNRLLLARLFTRSFNLLVMDEPTNDLDVETLELLESLLVRFEGTLLLVSHDRAFLDNVVTSTLAMEGRGRVGEYAGGYSDHLQQRPQPEKPAPRAKKAIPKASIRPERPRKLSYREKQDLEALPEAIESLEEEQQQIHTTMADPDFYRQQDGDRIAAIKERLAAVEQELEQAYDRWSELEALV